jgi:hypothetical protein
VHLIVPEVFHLNKIALGSSYTARIPTTDELFLETRHTANPVPLLTSQTRHYLENNIQFMASEYVGFQIKHQYGSLPAAFTLWITKCRSVWLLRLGKLACRNSLHEFG